METSYGGLYDGDFKWTSYSEDYMVIKDEIKFVPADTITRILFYLPLFFDA